jgi:hypothetical protein
MTFWYGSGSADPYRYIWLTDLTPAPDPGIFVSDLQDDKKKNFFLSFFAYYFLTLHLHQVFLLITYGTF